MAGSCQEAAESVGETLKIKRYDKDTQVVGDALFPSRLLTDTLTHFVDLGFAATYPRMHIFQDVRAKGHLMKGVTIIASRTLSQL